jgi:hypothetical protein
MKILTSITRNIASRMAKIKYKTPKLTTFCINAPNRGLKSKNKILSKIILTLILLGLLDYTKTQAYDDD